ncbi:hypothetical protein F0L68_00540 [Solihabitans fulvus]|uniref:Uncharacterized protein n=1 Tax=Solihabitans fulvus TaxID=1892852 RepID=A0A5B2XU80_9PSEU|nr:hypothetical protein [Solihabitans fulvus]KAA2267056.1 hypothetical protein F0L68_00540 [Solihabitans fulvus]
MSSRSLGLLCAAGYLVVGGAFAVAMLVPPAGATVAGIPLAAEASPVTQAPTQPSTAENSTTDTTTSTAPTTTTPAVPAGYTPVTGPQGVASVAPTGWPSHPLANSVGMQLDDPGQPGLTGRFVRLGAAPLDAHDLLTRRTAGEADFRTGNGGYSRVQLNSTLLRNNAAVVWEFEYDYSTKTITQRRHVKILYWETQGYEYYVYASAPADQWPTMEPVYQAMAANTAP